MTTGVAPSHPTGPIGPTLPVEWYPTPLYNFWGEATDGSGMDGGWGDAPSIVAAYPSTSLRGSNGLLTWTWGGTLYDASLSSDPTAPTPVQVSLGFAPVGIFPITVGYSGLASQSLSAVYLPAADGNLYLYVQQMVASAGSPGTATPSQLKAGLNLVGAIPNGAPVWAGGFMVSQAVSATASPPVYAYYVADKNGAVYKLTPSATNLLSVAFDLVLLSPIAEAVIIGGVGVDGNE